MTDESLTASECSSVRQQYQDDTSLDGLTARYEVSIDTLKHHLYAKCDHDVAAQPAEPPRFMPVTKAECSKFREQVRNGVKAVDIAKDVDRTSKTVTRHAIGDCDHTNDPAPVDKSQALKRGIISAEKCSEIRSQFRSQESDEVTDLAEQFDLSYANVLTHLNGDCTHEIDEPPRESSKERSDISAKECERIRQAWRSDPDVDMTDIATEFGASVQTVERHIKFACTHDHETVKADEMGTFDEYLE